MTIPARHDSLFKFTFSKAEHAASAIAAVLPAEIRQRITRCAPASAGDHRIAAAEP
jgi:hypothetical protein